MSVIDQQAGDAAGRTHPVALNAFVLIALGGIAVLALALLGVEMTRQAGNVASIWLPNVVALALLLRLQGWTRWVGVVVVGVAIAGANLAFGDMPSIAIGLALANLVEIGLALLLLLSIRFRRQDILTLPGMLRFLGIAGILSPLAGGLVGAAMLHGMADAPFDAVFRTWVMSGVLGAVILGPSAVVPRTIGTQGGLLPWIELLGWAIGSAGLVWLADLSGFPDLVFAAPALIVFSGIRLGLTASGVVGAALALSMAWMWVSPASVTGLPVFSSLSQVQVFLLSQIAIAHGVALLWRRNRSISSEIETYVHAFQNSGEGLLFIDAEDRFRAWNRQLATWLPNVETLGVGGRAEYLAENKLILDRLRQGDTLTNHPLRRTGPDGQELDLRLGAVPLFDEGRYGGAVLILRDVTEFERIRTLAEFRAAELEAVVDATPDLVIGTDATGAVNVWNRQAEEFYGIPRAEALGRNIFEIGSTAQAREIRAENFDRLMRGETVENRQSVRFDKDGVARTMVLSLRPIRNERGEITGTMANHRDITELVNTRETAARSERMLAEALFAIQDSVAIFDAREVLVICNQKYAELIGREKPAEAIGETWVDVLRRNVDRGVIDLGDQSWEGWFADRRASQQDGGRQFTLRLGDGRWLLGSDYPIPEGGFISVLTDISDIKNTEEALTGSNRDLEQFAFAASHDLQEPLRKISSFGNILVTEHRAELSEDAQTYLGFMMGASRRMQDLIRELLEYSRIGVEPKEPETIQLDDLVDTVLSDLSLALEEANATVTVGRLPSGSAHRHHLERILQNLILNSIKYRDPERPLVITIEPFVAGPENIGIAVVDNGMGFDMKHAEQILRPFKRLHSQTQIPGTGMGLAIVARLLRANRGRLDVSATEGEGARFAITLPRP